MNLPIPIKLQEITDLISQWYDTPAHFLENWAGVIETEADLIGCHKNKAIAAILLRAAEEIDKIQGITRDAPLAK